MIMDNGHLARWRGDRRSRCLIGTNTVVGAGAVVVRDLPANVVAVGMPSTGDPHSFEG